MILPDIGACVFAGEVLTCRLETTRLGRRIRIGLENKLCAPDDTLWHGNATFVTALGEQIKNIELTSQAYANNDKLRSVGFAGG